MFLPLNELSLTSTLLYINNLTQSGFFNYDKAALRGICTGRALASLPPHSSKYTIKLTPTSLAARPG